MPRSLNNFDEAIIDTQLSFALNPTFQSLRPLLRLPRPTNPSNLAPHSFCFVPNLQNHLRTPT
jgi:hypothetical protein